MVPSLPAPAATCMRPATEHLCTAPLHPQGLLPARHAHLCHATLRTGQERVMVLAVREQRGRRGLSHFVCLCAVERPTGACAVQWASLVVMLFSCQKPTHTRKAPFVVWKHGRDEL